MASGAITCGVAFGSIPRIARAKPPDGAQSLSPNAWVTLTDDGAISIISPGTEFGQGTMSTLPRYVAEELDADWAQVRIVQAPADVKKYGNPKFWDMQFTAGSRTTLGYFDVMRTAGAQARYVLMMTAAKMWNVDIGTLSTNESFVIQDLSGRRVSYASLVGNAVIPAKMPKFVSPDPQEKSEDEFLSGFAPEADANDKKASAIAVVPLKARSTFKFIGKDAPRVDIPLKVNGSAKYSMDMQIPGMVYAMVETGPVQGTVPAKIDSDAVRRLPGIVDVVRLPYGVAIVGSDIFAVRKGRELLQIDWTGGEQAKAYDSGKVIGEFAAIAADADRNPGVQAFVQGDTKAIAAALAKERTIAFESRSELVYHAPMEPLNATVRIAADGKSAECWAGNQSPRQLQEHIGAALGIEPEAVKVETPYVGGAFGRRAEPDFVTDAALVAKATGKTVKLIWTREDDLKRNPHRQAAVSRVEASIDPSGVILAMRHRVVADSWWARRFPDWFDQADKTDPGNWTGAQHLYDVPLQQIDCVTARRGIDVCYLRGIGVTQTKFALESLIDELAAACQADPLDYRLRLLKTSDRARQVLTKAAAMAEWHRDRDKRAIGIACAHFEGSHVATAVEISVDRPSGKIRVHDVWCAVDCGLAIQPAIVAQQMVGGIVQGLSMALFEQVTVAQGVIQQSNYHDYPVLRMSDAPRITVDVAINDHPLTGIGEVGVVTIAPAVANAFAKLTGIRLNHMPMLPERVQEALKV